MDIQALLAKIGQYGKGIGDSIGGAVRGAGDIVGNTLEGMATSGNSLGNVDGSASNWMRERQKQEELKQMMALERAKMYEQDAPFRSPTRPTAEAPAPAGKPFFNESAPAMPNSPAPSGKFAPEKDGFMEYLMKLLGR